jgi:hypothetical protein
MKPHGFSFSVEFWPATFCQGSTVVHQNQLFLDVSLRNDPISPFKFEGGFLIFVSPVQSCRTKTSVVRNFRLIIFDSRGASLYDLF